MDKKLINVYDLNNVGGIGAKTFEKILEVVDVITLEKEESTLDKDFRVTIPRIILEFMHEKWYSYLKEKNNKKRLWSYSRMSTFENSKYEYYLRYIKKAKADKTNVYLIIGGALHDLLEKYYIESMSIDEFKQEWTDALDQIDVLDLRFHADDDKNEKRKKKYLGQLRHYGDNFIPTNGTLIPELPIELKLKLENGDTEVFVGFIDMLKIEQIDGKMHYTVLDYKSSTIFGGKAMLKKAEQLYLYAKAIMTMYNVPVEQVHIQYDFLKYIGIEYRQKNGNIKTTQSSRHTVVKKISKDATRRMTNDFDYDIEDANDIINECLQKNSFEFLPDEIREIYKTGKAIVDVPIDGEILEGVMNDIRDQITDIKDHEKRYYESDEDEMTFWDKIEKSDEFYLGTLCCYFKQHKPYQEYLADKTMFIKDEYNDTVDKDNGNDSLNIDDLLDELDNL